jgi:CheY-like chemotaxis protein
MKTHIDRAAGAARRFGGDQVVTVYELGRPPDILMIDDNMGDAKLVEIAFRKARVPAHVIVASSAEAGLDILKIQDANTPRPWPDLIFLDLNLPSMHGLTFLDLIKSDPALTAIPVLVLSSSSAPNDIAASYSRHANGFVTKPSSLEGYLEFAKSIGEYWFGLLQLPPNAR